MAGYNWERGKSWNAVKAEEDGKMVASAWVKWLARFPRYKGLTADDIRTVVPACEWHHASKMFNRVEYLEAADIFENREDLRERAALRKEFTAVVKAIESAGIDTLHYMTENAEIAEFGPILPGSLKMEGRANRHVRHDMNELKLELTRGYAR
jgi:hypothetical protein